MKEAIKLDKCNRNTAWPDAIMTELTAMLNMTTFEVGPKGAKPPDGFQYVPYHFVFDFKFDLRCRA
jgi:hypothetical protein